MKCFLSIIAAAQASACGQKLAKPTNVKVSLAQDPGAGLEEFVPFDYILKDGYQHAACLKDAMVEFADKFGDGKLAYKADHVNVSIVWYDLHVPKEDAKPMSRDVCFNFCRAVPEMQFFALQEGRKCYCAPYYKPTASGSEQCDVPCEGAPTTMCGGMEKSDIFAMHSCYNSLDEFYAAIDATDLLFQECEADLVRVTALKAEAEAIGSHLKAAGGQGGDSTVSNVGQRAVQLQQALDKAERDMKDRFLTPFEAFTLPNADDMSDLESSTTKMMTLSAAGKVMCEAAAELALAAEPFRPPEVTDEMAGVHLEAFMSVSHYIATSKDADQSNCAGEPATEHVIVGVSKAHCAMACQEQGDNAEGHASKCVAFNYLAHGGDSVCELLADVESVNYYTKGVCGSFMQLRAHKAAAGVGQDQSHCMAHHASAGTFEHRINSKEAGVKQIDVEKLDRCYAA